MKLLNYLKESKSEMQKVVWPSRKETTNYTIGVIAISFALAAFFAIVDYFLKAGLEQLIR